MATPTSTNMPCFPALSLIHDVLIVGAGPAGLAVAARLREDVPSALFTDDEARRYRWIQKHVSRTSLRQKTTDRVKPPSSSALVHAQVSIHVLDEEGGGWLARWKRYFCTFGITQLRSPVFWHVDPQDRDALLSWAHWNGREAELTELKGCVGLEVSKHARKKRVRAGHTDTQVVDHRQKNDYFTPSQALFMDHCAAVAARYRLDCPTNIERALVADIAYAPPEDAALPGLLPSDDKLFTVTTSTGEAHYARAVVLAVGPANFPCIPPTILASAQYDRSLHGPDSPPHVSHSMALSSFPAPEVLSRIASGKETHVLIVGGGLTSVQLASVAVERGVSRVWLVARGPWRQRLFDVDLEWMGKFRNRQQAMFHGLNSDAERLERYCEARAGGSVPGYWMKRLVELERLGRVRRLAHTTVTGMVFDECMGKWAVTTSPPLEKQEGEVVPRMEWVYFATGIESRADELPYLQTMCREYPIEFEGGFPCLTDDLAWRDDVPLFFNGRLAALRVGPAAPNLGGVRVGAERIAWQVERMMEWRKKAEGETDEGRAVKERLEYFKGHANQFECLRAAAVEG